MIRKSVYYWTGPCVELSVELWGVVPEKTTPLGSS
jgi:hypothetical protein